MSAEKPGEVTLLLREIDGGNREAVQQLLPLLYEELRRMAGAYMRRERKDHTLQPTALVHEAFVQLVGEQSVPWQDRAHFLATAARAMRQVLIQHARARSAAKRGGDWNRVTLSESLLPAKEGNGPEAEILDLHAALEHLADLSERQSKILELRYFGGMTIKEIAHVLDCGTTTVDSELYVGKAWLARELSA